MTTDVPLLEARGLVVGHRTPLLRGVDLALHAGEAWFVLGDNGSGKTTLVATLLGLLPPLGGELRRRADVRHRTGYVPQDLRGAVALPIMAGEFVATAVGDRVPHGEASERVVHALDRVRASGLASRDVRTLSQGERRRVAIARALARDPVLLVVDEPLANLDEQTAAALAADLAGLRRAGICVVHVAHNRALARTTATHVAVVRDGAVEAGAAASMFVGRSRVIASGTWELFGDAILLGVALAALLPFTGIVLVARRQVFMSAAVGQAAALGIAVASWLGVDGAPGAMVAAIATAVVSLRARAGDDVAAVVFLVTGGAAMLLLANAPHGLETLRQLNSSSLLGASPLDPWIAAALLAVAVAVVARWPRTLASWLVDPVVASAHGSAVQALDVAVAMFIGVAIGFAIHAGGLPFTFACSVLPVLAARELAGSMRSFTIAAPCIGAIGFAAAFAIGDHLDLPPGQVTVVLLGTVAVFSATRRRRSP